MSTSLVARASLQIPRARAPPIACSIPAFSKALATRAAYSQMSGSSVTPSVSFPESLHEFPSLLGDGSSEQQRLFGIRMSGNGFHCGATCHSKDFHLLLRCHVPVGRRFRLIVRTDILRQRPLGEPLF